MSDAKKLPEHARLIGAKLIESVTFSGSRTSLSVGGPGSNAVDSLSIEQLGGTAVLVVKKETLDKLKNESHIAVAKIPLTNVAELTYGP